ncbi:MFS transporter [Paraburkholderia sp. CNPSo 3076]|uniref:MFS transporter n=1 Tax=Paraburkholderia sp. CNPSo 3076 TaxID=2940936 RepID=UPI002255E439|nr:MFS transporter [Paraburkholderia sp. CNPSo 3076]MCX5544140.1 MFS transporter [Paraburkholderia sp. CNPSo 3076]
MQSNPDQFNTAGASAAQRWHTLIASFLSYGFDAIDFMLLALTIPFIMKEFGISLEVAGLLGTAGMVGVGFSGVLIGVFSDRCGRKVALIMSIAIFGIFTFAIYFSRNWTDVLILRFLAGLGLGGVWGVISALVSESWPARTRGRAITFVLSAWPIGVMAAALTLTSFLRTHGWHFVFLFGGGSLLLIPYIWLCVPESNEWRAKRHVAAKSDTYSNRSLLAAIFRGELKAQTIIGTLTAAAGFTAYWGASTWLPTYLVKERMLSGSAMAWNISVLNIGMFIGYQLFGYVSDHLGPRNALFISLAGSAVMLPIYASVRDPVLLFWLGPVMALFFAFPGLFGAYFPRLYPTHVRSLGSGFCVNVGRGVSAFSPFLFGSVGHTWSLSIAIGLCGLGFFMAAVLTRLLPDIREPKNSLTMADHRLKSGHGA